MIKTRLILAMLIGMALSATVEAAPKRTQTFERTTKMALQQLKATVGKEFSSGLVFVNGRYLPPPYKVERYGTVLRINGEQVTGQIVPWVEFIKTQPSYKPAEKSEAPVETRTETKTIEVEEEVEETEDEGGDDDVDSLFDDESDEKKPASKKVKRMVKKTVTVEVPVKKAPEPKAEPTFEGEFQMNDRAKALLNKINAMRTEVDMKLRKGGILFFGSKYGMEECDPSEAKRLLSVLPAIMKDNSDYAAFASAMRAKNFSYLSDPVVRDLHRNRFDYTRLLERSKAAKEESQWEAILNRQ